MTKPKLALSMIVKSDEEVIMLQRCLTSVMPYVDKLFITGTNKPDELIQALVKQNNGEYSFYKWDKSFANARNYALSQIPAEYEYIMWCDSDDVWQNAELIPHCLDLMAKNKYTSAHFDYNYQISDEGKVEIVHPRERIVKNGYYEWKGALHETLIPVREVNNAYYKDIKVNHYPKGGASEENLMRNLEILENTYKEEGDNHDPRTEFYLARNLFDVGDMERAKKMLNDYLQHSGWDEERAIAHNYLGVIAIEEKDYELAYAELLEAVKERPNVPKWYVNLAYLMALWERWDDAIHFARLFVNTPNPKSASVQVLVEDELRYYETLFLIAMSKRKLEDALEAATQCAKIMPEQKVFQDRVVGVQKLAALTELAKAVDKLAVELEKTEETDKIAALISSIPSAIAENAYVEELRKKYLPPKIWPERSIVYYVGQTFEEWTPDGLKTGLGGSETAVIQLAKEWVARGYDVTVYNSCGTKEGVYDGVKYLNNYKWNYRDTFDTLILWRVPYDLDLPLKASRIWLDLHDVPVPAQYTKERVSKVDKIFVKSQFHRGLLPDVPDDKFVIITNGADLTTIPDKITKRGVKLVYTSSYDRGLKYVLDRWHLIRTAIPEAELHIYYGWNTFDAIFRNNPERKMWKAKMEELMKQPGIVHHGRVGKRELLKGVSEALIHYYPTDFEEIDCISVREAALVGTVPVMTDYAALKEKKYGLIVPGDPRSKETQDKIVNIIIGLLKHRDELTELSKAGIVAAREESWGKVANAWLKQL